MAVGITPPAPPCPPKPPPFKPRTPQPCILALFEVDDTGAYVIPRKTPTIKRESNRFASRTSQFPRRPTPSSNDALELFFLSRQVEGARRAQRSTQQRVAQLEIDSLELEAQLQSLLARMQDEPTSASIVQHHNEYNILVSKVQTLTCRLSEITAAPSSSPPSYIPPTPLPVPQLPVPTMVPKPHARAVALSLDPSISQLSSPPTTFNITAFYLTQSQPPLSYLRPESLPIVISRGEVCGIG
ncbi:hypothetical protein PLICRDRAFT_36821 [Plicaturopsis crispa FD-325 SS-3]|nr:hypothetical protein PLICRDRAFT_36821 [Plicaturopsis crispa FD-325 SS-3]